LEAQERKEHIVKTLEKVTDGPNQFETAKAQWAKLDKAFDDRIKKLNDFDAFAASSLAKAEEKFTVLQKRIALM